jgi:1A family penicillin-binding protein
VVDFFVFSLYDKMFIEPYTTAMRYPKLFYFSLFLLTVGALAIAAFWFFFLFFVPSVHDFEEIKRGETSLLYDRTGEHILYQIHGEENRKPLNHDEIPEMARLATIAIEDENFYNHYGVDPRAIFRALRVNIKEGGFEQGASTITQQLARSVVLSREKTIERKVIEALLAIKMDAALSKEEILDRYLNQVPYGSNSYGVGAAAETFFGKKASELTLGEISLLAALPNAPTLYSPYGNNTAALVRRQQFILEKLVRNGWITKDESDSAIRENAVQNVIPLKRSINAPHFVFAVLEELEKEYGRDMLELEGLHVYTTLDWEAQQKAEEAIKNGALRNKEWNAENAALVALDAEKGEILAMVGSKDYFSTEIDGKVNVATSPRQPGSSFKPLVYATAFEKGFQPETMLFDLPMSFGKDGQGNDYEPQNYDGRTHGLISMRQSLSNSLNIPAVQTQHLAGIPNTLEQVQKMGLTSLGDPKRYGLSLVLGSGEASLLQMANAYSVFSQEGVYQKATGVLRVEDRNRKILKEYSPTGDRVLSTETSRKIASILSDNKARSLVFGGNTPLAFPEGGVAAKTGTTQEFRDAWTLGFTRRVAVGVWVGNNDNTPMRTGADGVFVAAPIWRNYMDYLLTRYPATGFTPYQKVESDKPLLTGKTPFEFKVFESEPQNSKERRARKKEIKRITNELHSILYYVNIDDPLGPTEPNKNDPMFERFEAALNQNRDQVFDKTAPQAN